MRTTTTVARPGTRWMLAVAAALMLVMAFVVAGPFGAADATEEPPLPRLTADPSSGLIADATVIGWTKLTAPEACPDGHISMTAAVIADQSDRTFEGNVTYSASEDVGPPFAEGLFGDPFVAFVWGSFVGHPAFQEPGSYEILAFCHTDLPATNANTVAAFAAWLTFNDLSWEITAEKPSATQTSVTLAATADGEPVTDVEAGTEVELTATMDPTEATGSVEFFDSHPDHDQPVSLGEADVSSGTAAIALDDLEAGEYVLTAEFTPEDANEFAESQTAAGIPLTVNDPAAVQTTTTLTVAPESPVEVGAEVTMTATVAPGEAAGTVQFRAGTENVGEAVPVESGTAELTTTDLPEGELSLTASFSPTDPAAFTSSTSTPVPYAVGDTGPQVTAVDADGNPLGDNPVLQDGQVVTLTAPGFQAEEEVTITLDAGTETEEVLGEPIPADEEGSVVTEFTATALEPGQHQLDFAGAGQTLEWPFQLAGETGEENGTETGEENGAENGDDTGAAGGTDDGTAGTAGGAAGGANPSGSLAQTGAFIVGPALLLGLAAVSAGYAFVRRSRRDELLTFDDTATP